MEIKDILNERREVIDKEIEKLLPKQMTTRDLERLFGRQRYAYNLEAANASLSEPIWDLLDRGGKRWRPTLFLLIIEALGKDPDDFLKFVPIVEVIHNGTLMIDDIEDDSDLRRGKPCTHKKFGIDVAINAGNAMYFLPMKIIGESDLNPDAKVRLYKTYVDEMVNISIGQGTDIFWHKGGMEAIEEDEYLQMCAFKTGTLARMSAKFAAVIAGASDEMVEKLGRCAESIGVGFQIYDDVLNIIPTKSWGKGFGDDVKEGKRSLMVIHALKHATETDRRRLLMILGMHTSDEKLVREAVAIMERYGSIDYARKKATEIVEKSWKDVEPLLKESEAKEKLKVFVEYLVNRDI
ncbi:MAG: polyprenyl synthetase family protein [Candidatus Aenigmarchaeota archaeon]|nr:polyprenyl synthetase family protein [Candidatus Aenigmarchaeota archaeon]